MAPTPSITETLANLSIAWILAIVTGLTVVRLGLIRVPAPAARSLAEILESGLIAVVLVFLIIRPFLVQAFFIPTPSMVPTLLGNNGVGDHILVNKFEYRLDLPRRDDVVVFVAPPAALAGNDEAAGGNTDFIKRLIGRPGDRLQVVGGKVLINGTPYSHMDIRNALARSGIFGSDAVAETDGALLADHHVKFVADGVMADDKFLPKKQLAQLMTQMPDADVVVQPGYVLLNGRRLNEPFIAEDPDYDLRLYQGKPLKHDFAYMHTDMEYKLAGQSISKADYDREAAASPGAVPPGTYFMMGDNRNDSRDSTEWGPLDAKRVVGKAQFIFWPLSRIHAIQ